MKSLNIFFTVFVILCANGASAISTMVGDVTMRSAKLWFATEDDSNIEAVCSPKNSPEIKVAGIVEKSAKRIDGNIGVIGFENLDAGREYSYVISKKDT